MTANARAQTPDGADDGRGRDCRSRLSEAVRLIDGLDVDRRIRYHLACAREFAARRRGTC